jgi:hypothetical protein
MIAPADEDRRVTDCDMPSMATNDRTQNIDYQMDSVNSSSNERRSNIDEIALQMFEERSLGNVPDLAGTDKNAKTPT